MMRMVRVDTLGYVHAEIGRALPPKDGADLVLTLDLRAQTVADRLMHGVTGAMVVVDVNSGAVLAMASSPSYDLSGLTQDSYARMAGDLERRPLVNRALAAGYLPGSIIKPLIGMAILESGEGRPFDPLVYCPGKYEIGDTSIRCWRRVGHGDVDLVSAIERSCNTYFIKMGMTVGLDRIRPMLLGAGFGDAPGIDLPDAGAGLVPSREWAQRYWGRNWLAIDTAYLSIGQGAINVSPLQAALYVAAIGNGGKVFQPYIVREIRDPNGSVRAQTPVRVHHRLPVSVKTLQTIRAGMIRVVNGEHATTEVVRNPLISLAGKTGTAEVKSAGDEYNNTWFICYGPVDKPAYALAVVVERGESGGRTAAPLAARFFEQWLEAEK